MLARIKTKFLNFLKNKNLIILIIPFIVVSSVLIIVLGLAFFQSYKQNKSLSFALQKTEKKLRNLKNQDQYKINQDLKVKIKKSEDTYKKSIDSYQKLTDLRAQKIDTKDMDVLFASILNNLSALNYASAEAELAELNSNINKKYSTIASAGTSQTPANVSNSPPGSGYNFQAVKTDSGTFNVSIIAADLNSTRVVVDTASDSTCTNNCPVMALGDFTARSGAYAGINGSFFCPADYPSCAGKTNSFDTLLMNKNKTYFNSDNNVYSSVPGVIFSGNSARFVTKSLEWGRDTGVDAVLANYPLYVFSGQNQFGGSSDPKLTSKGARTFVANKGNNVYIGIVYNASSADAANVLKTLGMDNALGLDQGGSTALWLNGRYLAGPGRGMPNALLFLRR